MTSRTSSRSPSYRCSTRRSLKPRLDDLETRALLSTVSLSAHTTFQVQPFGGGGPPSGAYTPAQLKAAYGFNNVLIGGTLATGGGDTIAIVDAYNDPNIQTDLNAFDTAFSLPSTTVKVVNETGGTTLPASDSTGGWELEESLDVEWAHAMAPGANIILVEASSTSYSDLFTGVSYAATQANVVSMSWGGSEFSGENSYDSTYFSHPGVAYVASSGDGGAPASYPSASPNVLSVGGTTLTLGSGNVWSSETGWSDSGGGPSGYEAQPAYQNGVVTQTTTARATPDVAYDANPNTGVAVYDSVPYEGTALDWVQVGGTSAGAPQWSALLAIADQARVANSESVLNTTSPQQVQTILYSNPTDFHDITSGTSTGSPQYTAGTGYDYVTGMGTPIANLVVSSLVGAPAAPHDKLVVTATSSETAGTSFKVTVTAETSSGATDTGYTGTIHFTSSDAQAVLPANFAFPGTDDGIATFSVTLKTAGTQSITATDTSNSAITGTVSGIVVSPAPVSQLILSGLSSSATVGVAQSLKVTAEDPYGNVATTYAGTVQFTSSDSAATLPANSTFTTTNGGVQTFSITFGTAGTQSVTVTDPGHNIAATQSGIVVSPAAPTSLTATAASSSQINLSWSGSKGATGYLVQQSPNGSTGWTQIGTTSGTTTYQDTGLTAGTTYYFRVIATVGSLDSAASNIASATTMGTAPTPDTIWASTYTPSINAYSEGAYEVGLKFTSSVAGEVTGVRFFEQTWMVGQTNVGHLWSSSGTLLAAATFTNETGYGWQQVNFSSPVTITANTIYIASFSTRGYFGITTGFFTSGGVTSGPLEAEPNSVSGGNGVYNRSGSFPDVDSNGMNFWVDVAFTPSSGGAPAVVAPHGRQPITLGGSNRGPSTVDSSSRLGALTPATTPAGPARYAAGLRGTGSSVMGTPAYRSPIAQAATVTSAVKKSPFTLGSI